MNSFLFTSYPIKNPWTNVYGLARTVLAIGTLLTLLCNQSDYLFPARLSPNELLQYQGEIILYINFFYQLREHIEFARFLAIIILLVIASGYRPRFTAILHFWISMSFATYCICIEGGDQITGILTMFLIPICLTDSRKWHWESNEKGNSRNDYMKLLALSTFVVIRLQVAWIYLHAATAKFNVREWVDGTAVWYWFQDPTFGMNDKLADLMLPVMSSPISLTLITWGSLAIELLLFLSLFLDPRKRKYVLIMGIGFHAMILIFHGLFSFFFAMVGALILYLRPVEDVFFFPKLIKQKILLNSEQIEKIDIAR